MESYTDQALSVLTDIQREQSLIELSNQLMVPYALMALVLVSLMAFVYLSLLPEPDLGEDNASSSADWIEILKYPRVILGAMTLFCYVGVEVIAGDTIGLFSQELGVEHFGMMTSYTMGFMVVGYITHITRLWAINRNSLCLTDYGHCRWSYHPFAIWFHCSQPR